VLLSSAAGFLGCAPVATQDDPRWQAHTSGRFKVELTTDSERVQGHCKFVRHLLADTDPMLVARPSSSQLADWFREQAVLLGADTVWVDGRTGEAYICGPGPLNPDGSLQAMPSPVPVPSPTPRAISK
jgi:hypothetical protein